MKALLKHGKKRPTGRILTPQSIFLLMAIHASFLGVPSRQFVPAYTYLYIASSLSCCFLFRGEASVKCNVCRVKFADKVIQWYGGWDGMGWQVVVV